RGRDERFDLGALYRGCAKIAAYSVRATHNCVLCDADLRRNFARGFPLAPEPSQRFVLLSGPIHQNITFCRTALTRRRRAGVGFGARAFDTFPVRPSSRRIAALASTASECCAARSALIISGTPATRRMAA